VQRQAAFLAPLQVSQTRSLVRATSSGVPRSSSSLSVHQDRPPSSLSTRTLSSLSTRHVHNSRLLLLWQTLITQLTGLRVNEGKDGGARFRAVVASAMSNLEFNKAVAASADIGLIDRQIHGCAFNFVVVHRSLRLTSPSSFQACSEGAQKHTRSTQ
jgi:hypothetical protein